jgi:hypothetical protein
VRLRRDLDKLARLERGAADAAGRIGRRDRSKSTNTEKSESEIKTRVVKELLKYDQLGREMKRKKSNIFSQFTEMPICFLPTYKYDHRSHKFDSSAKRRKPSYTDRILFSGKNIVAGVGAEAGPRAVTDRVASGGDSGTHTHTPAPSAAEVTAEEGARNKTNMLTIEPIEYYSVPDCIHGDHRPVCAKFNIFVPQ